ncbi:MAG: iron ABC transporter permease, partial [Planctomycetes bacterium]|nr:iron ABC transporter permease [Planctomycetota bacterium]
MSRWPWILMGLAFGSAAVAWWAPQFGAAPLEGLEPEVRQQILNIRQPRAMLAWLAGGALAVSGALLQTLLRNGLATPFTLGVSSAASFGAFLVLAFPALAWTGSPRPVAFLFAMGELALVLAVAKRAHRSDGLLLAGVTFNFLFGALMMLVRYMADPYRLAAMDRWLMGSLDVVGFQTPLALLPWLLAGTLILIPLMGRLDQLAFDPELAEARGASPVQTRRWAL